MASTKQVKSAAVAIAVCAAAGAGVFASGDNARAADIHLTQGVGTMRSITIVGKIEQGDDEKFRQTAVRTIKEGNWISLVKIFSRGGNVGAAMRIGEQVRLMRASTVAPTLLDRPAGVRLCLTDIFNPISMQSFQFNVRTRQGNPECDCASACFIIWAAGVGRQGNVVGLHRPYSEPSEFAKLSAADAEASYGQVARLTREYFERMDVPSYIIDLMFAHSSQQIRYLTKKELQVFPDLTPAIGELRLARCGERPGNRGTDASRMKHFECTQKLYEEVSRPANEVYVRKYDK